MLDKRCGDCDSTASARELELILEFLDLAGLASVPHRADGPRPSSPQLTFSQDSGHYRGPAASARYPRFFYPAGLISQSGNFAHTGVHQRLSPVTH